MFGRHKRADRQRSSAPPGVGTTVATVDDANFFANTEGGFTMVAFWAPWCGPCRAFVPVFDDVAAGFGERVRFARCNIDENPGTAALLQIATVPTVIMFGPDGSERHRIVGVPPRVALEELAALGHKHGT